MDFSFEPSKCTRVRIKPTAFSTCAKAARDTNPEREKSEEVPIFENGRTEKYQDVFFNRTKSSNFVFFCFVFQILRLLNDDVIRENHVFRPSIRHRIIFKRGFLIVSYEQIRRTVYRACRHRSTGRLVFKRNDRRPRDTLMTYILYTDRHK